MELTNLHIAWLVKGMIYSPLISMALVLFLKSRRLSAAISIVTSAISFALAICIFSTIWNKEIIEIRSVWIAIGSVSIDFGFWLDNTTSIMMLLITGITFLVQIYSVDYLANEGQINRYWAHISLFLFAMLGLVVANNLLMLYVFWELVGFSSYLLIGFWYKREKAAIANKKAFIINRIGDLMLLIGIFMLFIQWKTFDLNQLLTFDAGNNAWQTTMGIFLIGGALAKSAQFPFHTWLPSAMEGPTSVSALIHAATMVAAGVYLLVRLSPIFTPVVLLILAIIGAFTAIMAASFALAQMDIKRVLAYSTISQLGLMVMAVGLGSSASALFHLSTHAFFKCLLFLSVGAIIHGLYSLKDKGLDEQDMRNMGGLKLKIPIVFWVYLIAATSLIGLPLFSGFLSKEAILIEAFLWAESRTVWHFIIPITALITTWLTAFYIIRQFALVFLGEAKHPNNTVHDASKYMKWPMIILAFFCFFIFFGFNPFNANSTWIMNGLLTVQEGGIWAIWVPVASLILVPILFIICKAMYVNKSFVLISVDSRFYQFFANAGYFDELYEHTFAKLISILSKISATIDKHIIDVLVDFTASFGLFLAKIFDWLDRKIIDGTVYFVVARVRGIGDFARKFQDGFVQHYIGWAVTGIALLYIFNHFFGL